MDKTKLICAMVGQTPSLMRETLRQAADGGADVAECRLDFLSPSPDAAALAELLADVPLPVIATNRPVREGGNFAGDESARLEILRQACAAGAQYADVELWTNSAHWPATKTIVSFHDFQKCPDDLPEILSRMESSSAAINKIAFMPTEGWQWMAAMDLLRAASKPTISLAMGELGLPSRILAKKFDAFGTFCAIDSAGKSAPGQPTLAEFRYLYRWDSIDSRTQVFGVIGCPVGHSLSPAIHNAAFSQLGVNAVYLPMRVEPGRDNFFRFMDEMRKRPWLDVRGLSVTVPHKENALAYIGAKNCDELAAKIGAVNTITFLPGGELRGDNTDYAAAIDCLCDAMGIARKQLSGRRTAVLGAGGAARAIVAALRRYGAQVTIYNRTMSRAAELAEEFGCQAAAISDAQDADAEIIINCTPIGMHPNVDDSPLSEIPGAAKVVFDTIYNPAETLLLKKARLANCLCVGGSEMLVRQAAAQFEIWTAQTPPTETMRQTLDCKLAQRR